MITDNTAQQAWPALCAAHELYRSDLHEDKRVAQHNHQGLRPSDSHIKAVGIPEEPNSGVCSYPLGCRGGQPSCFTATRHDGRVCWARQDCGDEDDASFLALEIINSAHPYSAQIAGSQQQPQLLHLQPVIEWRMVAVTHAW